MKFVHCFFLKRIFKEWTALFMCLVLSLSTCALQVAAQNVTEPDFDESVPIPFPSPKAAASPNPMTVPAQTAMATSIVLAFMSLSGISLVIYQIMTRTPCPLKSMANLGEVNGGVMSWLMTGLNEPYGANIREFIRSVFNMKTPDQKPFWVNARILTRDRHHLFGLGLIKRIEVLGVFLNAAQGFQAYFLHVPMPNPGWGHKIPPTYTDSVFGYPLAHEIVRGDFSSFQEQTPADDPFTVDTLAGAIIGPVVLASFIYLFNFYKMPGWRAFFSTDGNAFLVRFAKKSRHVILFVADATMQTPDYLRPFITGGAPSVPPVNTPPVVGPWLMPGVSMGMVPTSAP